MTEARASTQPLTRRRVLRRVGWAFATGWILTALLHLFVLARGNDLHARWPTRLLLAPLLPLLGGLDWKPDQGLASLGWSVGFGLFPLALGLVAVWRHQRPAWRVIAYVGFAAWWFLLFILMNAPTC